MPECMASSPPRGISVTHIKEVHECPVTDESYGSQWTGDRIWSIEDLIRQATGSDVFHGDIFNYARVKNEGFAVQAARPLLPPDLRDGLCEETQVVTGAFDEMRWHALYALTLQDGEPTCLTPGPPNIMLNKKRDDIYLAEAMKAVLETDGASKHTPVLLKCHSELSNGLMRTLRLTDIPRRVRLCLGRAPRDDGVQVCAH